MDWTHVSLSRLSSLLLRPEKVRHKISSFEKCLTIMSDVLTSLRSVLGSSEESSFGCIADGQGGFIQRCNHLQPVCAIQPRP